MPGGRKKKEFPALQDGLHETHTVQKSRPLFSLWKSSLTLAEFKILDTYLSRIDSHMPEQREVVFERGLLEKLLGVQKINLRDLDKRLTHLQQTVVNIGCDGKIDRITLFERAQGERDEHGLWRVKLTCTPSAMKYIFNIEHLGYLRYKIRAITQLSSLYSYILFTYLEYNRFRGSWTVDLEELKALLNCTAPSYSGYKEFNDKILKRCSQELHKKTDIQYSYEPIKRGRQVVAVYFALGTLRNQLDGQMAFDGFERPSAVADNKAAGYSSEQLAFLAEACDYEFTDEEMRVLSELIINIIPYDKQDGLERYNYLRRQYNALQLYSNKRQINNRFAYIKKILESNMKK